MINAMKLTSSDSNPNFLSNQDFFFFFKIKENETFTDN